MEDAIKDLLEKLADANATIALAEERMEEVSDYWMSSWDDELESDLLSLLTSSLADTIAVANMLMRFYENR